MEQTTNTDDTNLSPQNMLPPANNHKKISLLETAPDSIVREVFKIPEDEKSIAEFSCTLISEHDEYAGKICLFQNFLCFYSGKLPKSIVKSGPLKRESRLSIKGRLFGLAEDYFILDDDALFCFPAAHNLYTSRKTIPLTDIHSVVMMDQSETKQSNMIGFQIVTSKKNYVFYTHTKEEAENWIESIKIKIRPVRGIPEVDENKCCLLIIHNHLIKSVEMLDTSFFSHSVIIRENEAIEPYIFKFEKTEEWERAYQTLNTTASRSQPSTHEFLAPDDPRSVAFHDIFQVPETEKLIREFNLNWMKPLPTLVRPGVLFLTQAHFYFHSSLLDKLAVSYSEIKEITQPLGTSIHITTDTKEYYFVSNRHTIAEVFQSMKTLCKANSTAVRNFVPSSPEITAAWVKKYQRFTFLVVGSRGDVQPFIALAKSLIEKGHSVQIATHEAHRKFVGEWDIDFYPLAGDPKDLMALCVKNDMFTYKFFKEGIAKFTSFIEDLLETSWQACQSFNTQVLIQNPPTMAGVHIAEKMKIPFFTAFTMPWSRTEEFPSPFAVPNVPLVGSVGVYNYSTFIAVDNGIYLPLRSIINEFRVKRLELPYLGIGSHGSSLLHYRKVPFLYCWSPSVVNKPTDWGDHIHVTGYWFLEAPVDWKPPQELVDFLEHPQKPLYIGFGSVSVEDPDGLTKIIIEALSLTKQRAIIVKGWGGYDFDYPENILSLDSVPHDWLFPKMAGVIHHGGAGTTAAAFRAGVPSLIVPFFGDQYFWGNKVYELGVGSWPIPIKSMTTPKLMAGISKLEDPGVKERAKNLCAHIRSQDGVKRAVDVIYREIKRYEQKYPHSPKSSSSPLINSTSTFKRSSLPCLQFVTDTENVD
eukprot:TRINITY_DN3901_c0_g1_i1.p1 TRINITY_DN3901_c0_g1~~TRINITY_DN3901_c0_g1_i1.p1  ORF type:complete len:877 (-),score=158.58 TRINITY_DN3901_c0_g1_i1:51-2645(-)